MNVLSHILVTHAISGCDRNGAPYRRGKTAAFNAIDNNKDLSFLDVFKSADSTHDQISTAGETFLLRIYNAPITTKSLDELRYVRYNNQITSKKLTAVSGVELKALPPTSDAAKYHSYRAYYQVQQWLGNELPPTEWGWTRISQNENLVPVVKDKPAAPQKVLKLISCGCKQGCNRNCKCRKAGLLCTPLCSGCNGTDCTNSEHEESDA